MLSARLAVKNLKEYRPPLSSREGIRLDFNENTRGCSPRVLDALRSMTAEELARYPEREPVEKLVAQHLSLDAQQVLLTNGVDEAIHLLCEAYLEPRHEALIATPTFGMYEVYAAATGARIVSVEADAGFELPLDRLLRAITPATRLIAIANPNNPTGAVRSREQLLEVANAAPNAAVLIDEAYFEFYGVSVLDDLGSAGNIFVTRTFSKAYGLAGLRIGVLAGAAEAVTVLRRVSSPYNVNAVALRILPAALNDEEYVSTCVAEVSRGRERFAAALQALGIPSCPSQANFLLIRIGSRHQEFVAAMRRRGILVRDRSSDPGCEGWVRITIGSQQQTDALIEAMAAIAAELQLRNEVPA
jgi:histidinol-phosphate aminotransferase